jgi:hypothetical protein
MQFSSAEAVLFSNDEYLWSTFDTSIGLDDSFDQPRHDNTQREALMVEMYALSVHFNREQEMFYHAINWSS